MKQYLSMLLFDRKNLRFTDFVRLQQLEAQLGALAFDGVGDERHRLELMRQYNVPPLGFQRVPPTAFPPRHSSARPQDRLRRLRARAHPANHIVPSVSLPPPCGRARPHGFPRRTLE